MAISNKEMREKYKCSEGKELLVCDFCGHLYCGHPKEGEKDPHSDLIIHRCVSCNPFGGLK
jgi:hypothetical protein